MNPFAVRARVYAALAVAVLGWWLWYWHWGYARIEKEGDSHWSCVLPALCCSFWLASVFRSRVWLLW